MKSADASLHPLMTALLERTPPRQWSRRSREETAIGQIHTMALWTADWIDSRINAGECVCGGCLLETTMDIEGEWRHPRPAGKEAVHG